MKAVLVGKTTRELVDRPISEPGAGELLVRVEVAASNPKDWKYPFRFGTPSIQGSDAAGVVEAVGEGVTGFAMGDRVAAFTDIMGGDRTGTYAEYTIANARATIQLGPNTSFEDAAGVPLAYFTAVLGLGDKLGFDLTASSSSPASDKPRSVLIWGGATTVGVYAIQLAKKLGLTVVAVAGASADTAKAFGADVVLSYKSAAFEKELFDAVKTHDIHYVCDTVSENGTYQLAAKALDANDSTGGLITTVLPAQDADSLPKSVSVTLTTSPSIHKPDSPQVEALVDVMVKKAGEWLESGELKVQKVVVIPGGLGGVAEGLQRLQDGKVSGEKLVYRIRETPGLV